MGWRRIRDAGRAIFRNRLVWVGLIMACAALVARMDGSWDGGEGSPALAQTGPGCALSGPLPCTATPIDTATKTLTPNPTRTPTAAPASSSTPTPTSPPPAAAPAVRTATPTPGGAGSLCNPLGTLVPLFADQEAVLLSLGWTAPFSGPCHAAAANPAITLTVVAEIGRAHEALLVTAPLASGAIPASDPANLIGLNTGQRATATPLPTVHATMLPAGAAPTFLPTPGQAGVVLEIPPGEHGAIAVVPASGTPGTAVFQSPPSLPIQFTLQVPNNGAQTLLIRASVETLGDALVEGGLGNAHLGFAPRAASPMAYVVDVDVFDANGTLIHQYPQPVVLTLSLYPECTLPNFNAEAVAIYKPDPDTGHVARLLASRPVIHTPIQGFADCTVAATTNRTSPFVLSLDATPASSSVGADPRFFASTGFRVDDDDFYAYFQQHGGVATIGAPVSRTFTLLGQAIQLFQGHVLVRTPAGVSQLELLDDGDPFPYTQAGGAQLPSRDPSIVAQWPNPNESDYAGQVLAHLQAIVPDTTTDGTPVQFLRYYLGIAPASRSSVDGAIDSAAQALANLEVWGLPLSAPARDTATGVVYQRFQRAIMSYTPGSGDSPQGQTAEVPIGSYIRAIITGAELSSDLVVPAAESPLYLQYNAFLAGGLERPAELPNSDFTNAFEQEVPQLE